MRLTQTGTLALLMLSACGEAKTDDASPADGAPSNQDGDAGREREDGDAGALDACEAQEARETAFLADTDNVRCSVNDDCVAVGDCSNAEFIAVNQSARDAAEDLIAARCITAADGPGFHAVCSLGTCQPAEASVQCGQAEDRRCAAGMTYREPGCDAVPFAAGCYADCDLTGEDTCPSGFACGAATVNPCLDAFGQGTCDACAAEVGLCQPTCDVLLTLTLDGRPQATIRPNSGAAQLVASIRNRTESPVTFSYDAPCHGPAVTGLPSYQWWDACMAGACEDGVDDSRVTLTLAPGEVRVMGEELVTTYRTTCNDLGLEAGSYTLGWSLSNAAGASVCDAMPASLIVGPTW